MGERGGFGILFVRCSACGREVRVYGARFGRLQRRELRLPEGSAVATAGDTFVCPFCKVDQRLS